MEFHDCWYTAIVQLAMMGAVVGALYMSYKESEEKRKAREAEAAEAETKKGETRQVWRVPRGLKK